MKTGPNILSREQDAPVQAEVEGVAEFVPLEQSGFGSDKEARDVFLDYVSSQAGKKVIVSYKLTHRVIGESGMLVTRAEQPIVYSTEVAILGVQGSFVQFAQETANGEIEEHITHGSWFRLESEVTED